MANKRGIMLGQFIVMATNAHAAQFDRAGEPYILHVLEVLHNVRDLFGADVDEELECIAIGHDIFEDTSVTEDDIRAIGGTDRIVEGMFALTKKRGQSYDRYVETVLGNTDAMRVKMADLRHNSDITRLKGISDKDIERMGKYMAFYTRIKQKLDSVGKAVKN